MGYPSSSQPRSTGLNLSGVTKNRVSVISRYAFLVYVAMFYMNYPRCGDCAYSHISFIRECIDARDVSYVTVEGVELTVHNESVVVEKIKKVDVGSRRAQFI